MEMCFNEIQICVCLWEKKRNGKILSLGLELVKVGGYDFPHPGDGPRNSHVFFKRPLEFDMPALVMLASEGWMGE
jgi:hypothetical protein